MNESLMTSAAGVTFLQVTKATFKSIHFVHHGHQHLKINLIMKKFIVN